MRCISKLLLLGLVLSLSGPMAASAETRIPDELKSSGFFLGCQAYSWNRFTVYEAIE
jgi:hypothetical protein